METSTQTRAKKLLAEGKTTTETARKLGVDRHTLSAWLNDDEFSQTLREIQWRRQDTLREEIDAGAVEAVALLRSIVNDPSAFPGDRVRAASVLIDRATLDADRKTFDDEEPPSDFHELVRKMGFPIPQDHAAARHRSPGASPLSARAVTTTPLATELSPLALDDRPDC